MNSSIHRPYIDTYYYDQRFHFEGNFLLKGFFLENEGSLKEKILKEMRRKFIYFENNAKKKA